MNKSRKRLAAILLMAAFLTGIAGFTPGIPVFAEDTGAGLKSSNAAATEELDDTETELDALGFDTSELPEGYDPDTDTNPKGTEYTTLQEFGEIFVWNQKEGIGTLFGRNNDLNNSYDAFLSGGISKSNIDGNNNSAVASAAGDFYGTGRKSCIAFLSMEKVFSDEVYSSYDLVLRIYDSEKDICSDPIIIESRLGIDTPMILQSIFDIDTGDYNGDGLDEIAVTVPQSTLVGAAGTEKIAFFKLKSPDIDVCDSASWKEVWSYSLPNDSTNWNCVDLASGDLSGDGIDDMIVSWGKISVDSTSSSKINKQGSEPSSSVLIFGDRTGEMLRNSVDISYGGNDICRVAFAIGDINGDGENDAILGGQMLDEAVVSNESRALGYFSFDKETGRLIPELIQDISVVDGEMQDGSWQSVNGFDDKYYSLPVMKANLEIADVYGKAETNCIYLDSVVYRFDDEFSIVDELDEHIKDTATGDGHSAGGYYFEYDAKGSYYAGSLTQGVKVSRVYVPASGKNGYTTDTLLIHADPDDLSSGNILIGTRLSSQYVPTADTAGGVFGYGGFCAVVDSDNDSAVMRYTGNHTFTYSKPKVYAVLASAPYFRDVAEHSSGQNVKTGSKTSWGQTTSGGSSDGENCAITISVCQNFTSDFCAASGQWGWYGNSTTTDSDTTSFTMKYSTIAGQDCVVFYSIPTAIYEYEIEYLTEDEDGNTVTRKEKEYVTIPYQPVSQTIALDTYNEIQKTNTGLPVLDGTAITSTCGDPASYPSSERGFKDATVFKGDWSAPAYAAGGDVSQDISFSKSHSETKISGFHQAYSYAVGTKWSKTGIAGTINAGDVSGSVTTEGTSAGGTVSNMPLDAKDYGYYFSWKLMTYTYETPDGDTYPVVTYLVKDVTEPPALPTDFRQDYSRTTDSEIGLSWTYTDKSVTSFDIYRHDEYLEGSNDVLVGTISASDYTLKKNGKGELVYDENGNTIRQYSFVDRELSEYTEYKYQIQVNRSKVPPKSIRSRLVTCKTRAAYHPEIELSDTELTVYYDTIRNVSIDVEESDSFLIRNKSFQWQKYDGNDRVWKDIPLADSNTYKFSKCQLTDAGEYRCRVNAELTVLGNVYKVTTYSETLTVKFSRRDVKFGEIECTEEDNITRFTLPVTNCGDGARTQPHGVIVFTLDNGQETKEIVSEIDGNTNTATAEYQDLPDGAYELKTAYVGNSKIFKDADNPESFTYMKNITTGMWLSLKSSYRYNEDLMDSLKLYDLYSIGGYNAEKEDITDTITKIRIVDNVSGTEYAEYTFDEDRNARIPCRYESAGSETFDRKNLVVEVYVGDTKVTENIEHKLRLRKGECSIYLDDMVEDAGAACPDICWDKIKIRNADGYEDGASPFIEGMDGPGTEAFTDHSKYRIGVYTPAGHFLGYTEGEVYGQAVNLQNLSPGQYILKPRYFGLETNIAEKDFFDITYEESTLTLLGDTYEVTAEGDTINGRNVGTVSLISPMEDSNPQNVKIQGGTALTFKAHPAANYAVSYWVVNESGKDQVIESSSETLQYTVKGTESHITVKAVFMIKTNHLSMQTIGGGTESTVECISDSIGSNPVVSQGKNLTFRAIAGEGYEFVEWRYVSVDGKTLIKDGTASEDGLSNEAGFTMGEVSATVYAVFQRQKVDISLADHLTAYYLNTSEYNAYLAEGTEVAIGSDMKVPAEATVIVRPEAGYKVSGDWTVETTDKEGTTLPVSYTSVEGGKSIRFNMPAAAETVKIEAASNAGHYSINTSGTVNGHVDVYIDGRKTDAHSNIEGGTAFELTAVPERGFVFDCWKVNNRQIENAGVTYAGIITGNMDVKAVYKPVEGYDINVDIEGQPPAPEDGAEALRHTVDYSITTAAGTKTESETAGTEPIRVFNGESITFHANAADNYMASYVIVDGRRFEITDDTYTVSNISSDCSITVGFESAVYHTVKINKCTGYDVRTSEGRQVSELTLTNGEICTLVVTGPTDLHNLFVFLNDDKVETVSPVSGSSGKYEVTFRMPDCDSELNIGVYTYHISSAGDFIFYCYYINNTEQMINGVLDCDIEVTPEMFSVGDTYLMGTFDGNGHCIYGSGPDDVMDYSGFRRHPLFTDNYGTVKNLTLKNFGIRAKAASGAASLITDNNYGTIENCAVSDVDIEFFNEGDYTGAQRFGVFTYNNYGKINSCLVRNTDLIGAGSAFAYMNGDSSNMDASINNCYADGFTINGIAPTGLLCAYGGNEVINCRYNIDGAEVTDQKFSGSNVYKDGVMMTPGELASALNSGDVRGNWGLWSNEPTAYTVPVGTALAPEGMKAALPAKIEYRYGYRVMTDIVPTGYITLPAEIDGVEIAAWTDGKACYSGGTRNVLVERDTIFKAVEDPEGENCCRVEYGEATEKGACYFADFASAAEFAARNENAKVIVISDVTVETDVALAENISLEISEGAELTVQEEGSLESSGAVTIEENAVITNYGSFQINSGGSLAIYGEFRNSGAYACRGEVRSGAVTCINHSWGKEEIIKAPTTEEEGESCFKCEVCGYEEYMVLDRLAEEVAMSFAFDSLTIPEGVSKNVSVALDPAPDQCLGKVTWSTDNPDIAAVETEEGNGTEATVTGVGAGTATITAVYENEYGYKTSISAECTVKLVNPITEISFGAERYVMFAGGTKALKAAVTPVDTNETLIWESEDESIVTVNQRGVLTAESTGETTVTVRSAGECGGDPVAATVIIKVIEESTISGDIETLREQLQAANDEYNKTKADIQELEAEIAATEKKEADTEEARLEMEKELERLNQELTDAKALLAEEEKEIQDINDVIAGIESDIRLYFTDNDILDVDTRIVGDKLNVYLASLAVGGTKPYTFTAGNLPKGITISEDGVLSGTFAEISDPITATITVTDAKGASESIDIDFAGVKPAGIKAKASASKFVYSGKVRKPVLTVTDEAGRKLTKGTDYTITYTNINSKKVGKYKATIKGIGNYTGKITKTYRIKPKKAVVSKVVPGKKKLTVRMKTKVASTGGGTYQIAYKQKGTGKWKYTTTTKQSKVIKKLKKGKRYYVKVRAYKTVSKVKYYGTWSKKTLSKMVK